MRFQSKTLAGMDNDPHAAYITRLIHDVAERASYDGTLGAQVAALAVRGIVHTTDIEWTVLVEVYGTPTTSDWMMAQAAYGPTANLPGRKVARYPASWPGDDAGKPYPVSVQARVTANRAATGRCTTCGAPVGTLIPTMGLRHLDGIPSPFAYHRPTRS
jgi:hypothetical protein